MLGTGAGATGGKDTAAGRGVSSTALSSTSLMLGVSSACCLGCGVPSFIRGRAFELMTDSKKDFRRVWGVTRSSSSSCPVCGAGVWNSSAGGLGRSKRALGRGNAGVGVIANEGAADEAAVPTVGMVKGMTVLLLKAEEGGSPSEEKVGSLYWRRPF